MQPTMFYVDMNISSSRVPSSVGHFKSEGVVP